ncbi:tRNA pseudouridine(55) synthase TruB [uncultured Actinomyces sp.]|uniref:tRNA pseudouridine(55) synthase TruB n=1 Tax=uncultured Actinomyces sp. TaxID=249061 RepID=UPI002805B5E4|nr:tRNA pseudouridine(55) synthase TruB [uncultured Actinomyces sp.]
MKASERAEPVDRTGRHSGPDRARRRPDVPRGAVTAADGILVVDKPQGLTSHDVVGATRRLAATRKVGHAGTLDPMATGLLLLGIGRATRFLTYLVGADKTYEATVRLGVETTTEDADGEIVAARGCRIADLPEARLHEALTALSGPIQQVPSAVSAIKVDGVRAYQRVRDGQDVELQARPVTIHELRLTAEPRKAIVEADGTLSDSPNSAVQAVDIDILVSCSSGTYVRALARDLGRALGCGAHLTALRRTAVGPFDIDEAHTLADLSAQVETDASSPEPHGVTTLPLEEVARRCFERLSLTEDEARALRYGQPLDAEVLERAEAPEGRRLQASAKTAEQRVVAGFAPGGRLVALLRHQGPRARPVLVLDPA